MSYSLSSKSPYYSGIPPITFQKIKSMVKKDGAKTTRIGILSHIEEYINFPKVYSSGKTERGMLREGHDLLLVCCFDIQVKQDSAIRISEIEQLVSYFQNVVGLFVRNGMYQSHETDPDKFCTGHLGVYPNLPRFFRAICPAIRLFNIDTISISNHIRQIERRGCRRAFLCGENSILVAEDLEGVPAQVFVKFRSQSDDFLKDE
jgi:kynurenine formamidase